MPKKRRNYPKANRPNIPKPRAALVAETKASQPLETGQSHENQTEKQSNAKTERHQNTCDWRHVRKKVSHDFFSSGPATNFWVGIIILLLTPGVAVLMNGPKASAVGVGVGLTILVWWGVYVFCKGMDTPRELAPQAPVTPSAPASPPKEISSPHFGLSDDRFTFIFATNSVTMPRAMLESAPQVVGLDKPITVSLKEGRLVFSADLVMPDGKGVTRIRESRIEEFPTGYDLNHNADWTAVEIVNAEGAPMLQRVRPSNHVKTRQSRFTRNKVRKSSLRLGFSWHRAA